jgi:hypothetical protein
MKSYTVLRLRQREKGGGQLHAEPTVRYQFIEDHRNDYRFNAMIDFSMRPSSGPINQ